MVPSHVETGACVPSSFPASASIESMQYSNMPYGIPPMYAPMPIMPPGHQPLPPYAWNPYPQYPMAYLQYPLMGHHPWSQHNTPIASPSAPNVKRQIAQTTPPKPKASILHHQPLNSVSPYADTHTLLSQEIVIYKEEGESFGVSFAYDSRSVLVDPDTADRLNGLPTSAAPNQSPVKEKNSVVKSTSETRNATGSADGNNVPSINTTNTTATTNSSATDTVNDKSLVTDNPSAVDKVTDTDKPPAVQQRRPRRRRVFFGVLKVVTAETQNARFKTDNPSKQLQPGDIVLKVNNQDVGGLTFQQAVRHFASCSAKAADASDSLIQCPLVVARAKPVTRPASVSIETSSSAHGVTAVPSKVPFVLNTLTDRIVSGDFTAAEVMALAQGCMRCISTESRALGHVPPMDMELTLLQGAGLALRDLTSIARKLNHSIRIMEQSMKEAARSHWANQWNLEELLTAGTDLQIANLTDAERSALRELPRPLKGCRCGSPNHEYVNDVKCVLYRNLRFLPENNAGLEEERKLIKKAKSSDLNAIQMALKDRILKLKDATEREEEEARFVEKMEKFQVTKLKRAVFAPSLTAMVLSAIAALANDLSGADSTIEDVAKVCGTDISNNERPAATAARLDSTTNGAQETEASPSSKKSMGVQENSDDDDDDDIPLMDLCKRSNPSSFEPEAKRLKTEDTQYVKERPTLNVSFMAKMLHHISHTWGHLYAEPSDSDYAWRWEVYHGQTSTGEARRDSKLRNPRPPDSLSFENIRFSLTGDVVSRLSAAVKQNNTTLEAANDILLVHHLLSPKRTGLYDEVMALTDMGVLRRTRTGCLVLANDWYSHVDPLLLDEMEHNWSKRVDPTNKHCICRSMRTKLERSWRRVERGWSLSDEPEDVIYRDDEWEEWRSHFRDRFDSQINEADGIEKFGI